MHIIGLLHQDSVYSRGQQQHLFEPYHQIMAEVGNIRSCEKIIKYHISSVTRQVFPFHNNPKYLDLSYKMDLDFWDCLGRVTFVL